MARYEGNEHTGIAEIDSKIDALRAKRDRAAEEQSSTQKEIDALFLSSMVPDIKKGDYISYMKDDMTTMGKVHDLRRVFGGVTIEFDIVAFIPWADEYENINPEIRVVSCTSHHETLSVKKNDLSRISKITREHFIGTVRKEFEDVLTATKEPENSNQLKLNL